MSNNLFWLLQRIESQNIGLETVCVMHASSVWLRFNFMPLFNELANNT